MNASTASTDQASTKLRGGDQPVPKHSEFGNMAVSVAENKRFLKGEVPRLKSWLGVRDGIRNYLITAA